MSPDCPYGGLPRLSLAALVLLSFGWSLSLSSAQGGELAEAIVFVSRDLGPAPNPMARTNAVERARSGRLVLLTGGTLRVLVEATPASPAFTPLDVQDPDVSFDGRRVLFSGYNQVEGGFRIYEVGINGSGLRQVTRNDRDLDLSRHGPAADLLKGHDDLDPCYLPDGRICFVSTRYPEIAPDGRARSTNLYVANADGSGVHRITTERFGADTPAVEPATGRIVYSRWWRTAQVAPGTEGDFVPSGSGVGQPPPPGEEPPAPPPAPAPIPPGSPGYGSVPQTPGGGKNESEVQPRPNDPETAFQTSPQSVLGGVPDASFPGVNSWFLAGINPDGTGLAMHSGFRLDRELTQAYRPSFMPDGRVLSLFIPVSPFLGNPGPNGLRIYQKGMFEPEAVSGPQTFSENSAGGPDGTTRPVGITKRVYASAAALPDGRILVSAAAPVPPLPGNPLPRNYDIFIETTGGAPPVLVFGEPGRAELDAVPVVAREVPPVVPDQPLYPMSDRIPATLVEAIEENGTFTFICENIFFNGPVDLAIPHAPPVGKNLSIEFFTSPQRTGVATADTPILVSRQEIGPDGRVEAELPAGVPLFEVLRRPDGSIPVGRDGQIFHVGGMNFGQADQDARCLGCHAGHSVLEMPEDPTWTNLAPSAVVNASSLRLVKGVAFKPEALVDRRTDAVVSEWAAGPGLDATIELTWKVPLRAKKVVLYVPDEGQGQFGPRTLMVWGYKVTTSLNGELREERTQNTQSVPSRRRSILLNTAKDFDALTVTIRATDVTGQFEGREGIALAELEVIAQVAESADLPNEAAFLRSDANCDGKTDVTDPIRVLGSLFLGEGSLCCGAAADANADGSVNVTDVIHLLSFMLMGGERPAAPFPACGNASTGTLGCAMEVEGCASPAGNRR